jgi:RNA recognition motif-containing protein
LLHTEIQREMATRLYVGNLPYTTTEDELRAAFEGGGRRVREVLLIADRESGRPKGFGFVEMGSAEDAQSVIAEFDGQDFGGRVLKVSIAKERAPGPPGR